MAADISYRLYEDQEGIIRLKGRLSNSSLSFDTKHPILLPSQHHAYLLIIDQAHQAVMVYVIPCRSCVQSFGLSRDVRELSLEFMIVLFVVNMKERGTPVPHLHLCLNLESQKLSVYRGPPTFLRDAFLGSYLYVKT